MRRTASIFFFQGLCSLGVVQWPRKSVSLTAHAHLSGLHFIPLLANLSSTLSTRSRCSSWLPLVQMPTSSMYISQSNPSSILVTMRCCAISPDIFTPIGRRLYLCKPVHVVLLWCITFGFLHQVQSSSIA